MRQGCEVRTDERQYAEKYPEQAQRTPRSDSSRNARVSAGRSNADSGLGRRDG